MDFNNTVIFSYKQIIMKSSKFMFVQKTQNYFEKIIEFALYKIEYFHKNKFIENNSMKK